MARWGAVDCERVHAFLVEYAKDIGTVEAAVAVHVAQRNTIAEFERNRPRMAIRNLPRPCDVAFPGELVESSDFYETKKALTRRVENEVRTRLAWKAMAEKQRQWNERLKREVGEQLKWLKDQMEDYEKAVDVDWREVVRKVQEKGSAIVSKMRTQMDLERGPEPNRSLHSSEE